MSFIRSLVLCLCFLICAAHAAQAAYFVWTDDKSGLSLSFPDDWQLGQNVGGTDVVTLMAAPSKTGAVCRMNIRDDHRFLFYPVEVSGPVQKIAAGRAFWVNYLSGRDNVDLVDYEDDAGLGLGYASKIIVDYRERGAPKRAMLFASLYHDKFYIWECSANRTAFPGMKQQFLWVTATVQMTKIPHELYTGDYRNFLRDPGINFPSLRDTRLDPRREIPFPLYLYDWF